MNLGTSLRDRLKNQARQQGIAYASLLEQFALSRFLARLERNRIPANSGTEPIPAPRIPIVIHVQPSIHSQCELPPKR
jgi:hypothetical protein